MLRILLTGALLVVHSMASRPTSPEMSTTPNPSQSGSTAVEGKVSIGDRILDDTTLFSTQFALAVRATSAGKGRTVPKPCPPIAKVREKYGKSESVALETVVVEDGPTVMLAIHRYGNLGLGVANGLVMAVRMNNLGAMGMDRAVTTSPETQTPLSGKTSEPREVKVDPQHFLLMGTALHEDGSPCEGLEVVLFSYDKTSGKSRVGYGLNPGTGHVELGNPNAKTDAAGRFVIKVNRGYLNKDKEETEFRIGYLRATRRQAEMVEMGKRGSKEPLALKIRKDVEKLELSEIW